MKKRDGRPPAISSPRVLSGDGWSVREIVCNAGPSDRAFEERHADFSVSAVLAGAFTYRTGEGRALLYPGSLLLGNSGQCFECGHEHGVGDRCVAMHLRDDLFAEIAAASAATSRFRFSTPSLPPSARTAPIFAFMESVAAGASPFRRDEIVLDVVASFVKGFSGERRPEAAPTNSETRRVVDCLRFIDAQSGRPIQLRDLAARAGLSKFHFLRIFRRLTGVTPHQYLLSARLRRAARALRASRLPVLEIALDSGFGDLSTFNHRFRGTFGMSPTQYRAS